MESTVFNSNILPDTSREIVIQVLGMHCVSCELWIERTLLSLAGVELVKSEYNSNKITIRFNNAIVKEEDLLSKVRNLIAEKGYTIKEKEDSNQSNFSNYINTFLAFGISIFLGVLYKLFLGEISVDTNVVGSGMIAFIIVGAIASISNCGMTVGSLFLGWLSNKEKIDKISKKDVVKYLSIFNVSRVFFYFILGGILGYLGSFIMLNDSFNFWIQIISAIVILSLAFNLLDIFKFIDRFIPHLPSKTINKIFDLQNINGIISLVLIAFFSFFLPCGFTLAVQTQALETGSPLNGAMIMSAFAIGTVPIISLVGYLSNSIANSKFGQIFFKIIGFLMLFYAISLLLEIFKFY